MLNLLLGLELWQLTLVVLGIALLLGFGFSTAIRKVFRLCPSVQESGPGD